jgi:pyruvate formate lyase activating enzyme
MNIKHIHKTTLIDFPGQIASTIFVSECNFNCNFCYNSSLIEINNAIPSIPQEEAIAFLNNRKHLIDGIAITGGEPTLQKDLIPFLNKIRELGLKIKIDTNGYKPEVLAKILEHSLADYIAMDIKASFSKYSQVANKEINIKKIAESIEILMASTIEYEFRTTVWNNYFNQIKAEELLAPIKKAKNYYLHNYVNPDKNSESTFYPMPKNQITPILDIAKKLINNVQLRGNWY